MRAGRRQDRPGQPQPVEASRPVDVAGAVVLLGPLALEQRLGASVPRLLLPVHAHRVAAVMPHDGARMEAERPPPLAQPPADVHVVAGGSELVVESPDLQQRRPAERHVAAGDVLGFLVGEEDVDRSAGRVGDGLGHRAVARRRDVRAPDADVAGPDEGGGEVAQPVRVGIGVVVGVGDDLARRGAEPDVPRVAQAAVLAADHPEAVLLDDVHRPVGGAVVDDDHLEVRVVETPQALAGSRGWCEPRCRCTRRPRSAGAGRPARRAPRPSPAARRPGRASAAGRGESDRSPSHRCRGRPDATCRSRRTRTRRPHRRRRSSAPASRASGPAEPGRAGGCPARSPT